MERRTVIKRSLAGTAMLLGMAVGGGSGLVADAAGPQQPAASQSQIPAMRVRRVIAANDAQGKSYILTDDVVAGELWKTSADAPLGVGPAGESTTLLPSTRTQIDPAAGGTRMFVATIGHTEPGAEQRGFHRTSTLDYIYVLDGEVALILDKGETKLKAGDVAVLRNAWHSWRNDAQSPVRLLVSMVRVGDSK